MKPKSRQIVRARPTPTSLDVATAPTLTPGDVANLEGLLQNVYARNTKVAYESDWAMFQTFCESRRASALPAHPATIVAYLTALSKGEIPDRHGRLTPRKIATIKRHLATISVKHTLADQDSPRHAREVRVAMQSLRRTIGAPQKPKTAAIDELLYAMVRALPDDVYRTRNAAILLVGFFGAMRRSEVVAINLEDISPVRSMLQIVIPRSKADQEGKGQQIELLENPAQPDVCPVTAVARLRAEIGDDKMHGPLFRRLARDGTYGERLGARAVAKLVQTGAKRLGLNPKLFAGHSLRSGFATSAKLAGADLPDIQHQTRHKSIEQLAHYIQNVGTAEDHAAAKIIIRGREKR